MHQGVQPSKHLRRLPDGGVMVVDHEHSSGYVRSWSTSAAGLASSVSRIAPLTKAGRPSMASLEKVLERVGQTPPCSTMSLDGTGCAGCPRGVRRRAGTAEDPVRGPGGEAGREGEGAGSSIPPSSPRSSPRRCRRAARRRTIPRIEEGWRWRSTRPSPPSPWHGEARHRLRGHGAARGSFPLDRLFPLLDERPIHWLAGPGASAPP